MNEVNRKGWPPGPWDLEGDRYEWRDEATGLPCLAKRNRLGALCGYVAVPPDHPWHGLSWDEIDDRINVHGGLTYADYCNLEAGICHVPAPGESDDVFWLGFDCAHAWDTVPYILGSDMKDVPELMQRLHENTTYKPIAYVRSECTDLAAQVHDAAQ